MTEVVTFRKNKIELAEYDFSKDVQNRVLMAQFSQSDVEILEEILYSSLRIPISVLQRNLGIEKEELLPKLEWLTKTGLFKLAADHVLVDKEMRKYYEFQILKFEEDFKPGMEYLQGLLRKVPIHILPNWYAISRTSNNIFESIVEKYFKTPQIFQRYLMELNFSDPVQKAIFHSLYRSPRYEMDAEELMKRFDLSQEEFEKHMIFLEFNFVACIQYVREKSAFKQIITPFHEWKEYLCFVRDTEPSSILEEDQIKRLKTSDFAVIEEMSALLEQAKKGVISEDLIPLVQNTCPEFDEEDFSYYVKKFCTLNFADYQNNQVVYTSDSDEWLKMDLVDRALYLYRHPLNAIENPEISESLGQHRILREAEKSLCIVLNSGWVILDDFLKAIFIPLREEQIIHLVRHGRTWKYHLPEYSEEEKAFFKAVIQNWLFDFGITALGTIKGRECFTLTSFGQDLFSNE